MDFKNLIIPIIEGVLFLSGFIGLFIKVNTRFVEMEKDVASLKNSDIKQDARYEELLRQVNQINMNLVELTTTIKLINNRS